MKHFTKIADGFDVKTCLAELGSEQPTFPVLPHNAPDIGGRPAVPPDYRGVKETAFGPATRALLEAAYRCLETGYYRAGFEYLDPMVLACPPGARVRPHRDYLGTDYGRYFFRFQLAIQCDQRAFFRIGTDRARFKPGELWLCDIGDRAHEMRNDSDRWRIVLRFDARPVDQKSAEPLREPGLVEVDPARFCTPEGRVLAAFGPAGVVHPRVVRR